MAGPGETLHSTGIPVDEWKCYSCRQKLKLEVLQSAAGYYIGTFCKNCGPYSRESGYYATKDEAATALTTDKYGR